MVLATQTGAVNRSFHAYTTAEWCMSSQMIRETRGVVAVVTETCVPGTLSHYSAALYIF